MGIFSSLRREQKEAIVLLQTGTFLEYFDLMLYVHMAVLLNELFFPKTDPRTASLLAALSFCSTFVMRPIGALAFGYIGDKVGRKTTVILTTMLMAISCVLMANLPTYAKIGIAASWLVTICRIIQGLSSMGEVIGAEIYLTEITKSKGRHTIVSLLGISCVLGSILALGIASLVTSADSNWRSAFWFGAIIAVVGAAARTRLRETPDFVDMKRRIKKTIEEAHENGLPNAANLLQKTSIIWKEKVNKKTALAFFLISCAWPACFFFSYIHCAGILKNTFGFTPGQIIFQNFKVSLFELVSCITIAYLSSKVHPLKIMKVKFVLFFLFALSLPFILAHIYSPFYLLLVQAFAVAFGLSPNPAYAVYIQNFPVFKRFTYYGLLYAISRAVMYVITAFSLVYLINTYGHYGLWFIMVPISLGFYWGVRHFEKLEYARETGKVALKEPSSSEECAMLEVAAS